jgi:hypothetical protein
MVPVARIVQKLRKPTHQLGSKARSNDGNLWQDFGKLLFSEQAPGREKARTDACLLENGRLVGTQTPDLYRTSIRRLTIYALCVKIYAKCVHHLSLQPFSPPFDSGSWRQRCCLPKGPGIFPNWRRTLGRRHRASSENSKRLPRAGSCKGDKKAVESTSEQKLLPPFSRNSAICFRKRQGSFLRFKPSSRHLAPRSRGPQSMARLHGVKSTHRATSIC